MSIHDRYTVFPFLNDRHIFVRTVSFQPRLENTKVNLKLIICVIASREQANEVNIYFKVPHW